MEKEKFKKIAFLDVCIDRSFLPLKTMVHKKETDTGLLTNFNSFTSFKYKVGLVKTMIDRVFKINSTREGYNKDMKSAKIVLQKNEFPSQLIDKNVKIYLDQKNKDKEDTLLENDNCRYYKLPYLGRISEYTEKKLKQLIKQFCKKTTSIKLAFKPDKISNYFSIKDKHLEALRSNVVYKFSCAGCNSSYVGYTTRHLSTRIREHLSTDKNSHIFKHLNASKECKCKSSELLFTILDSAQTKLALRLKESMWIKWINPNLNIQKEHNLTVSLCL